MTSMISEEKIESLVQRLRDVVPLDIVASGFNAHEEFFTNFEDFKLPLIVYLADHIEEALIEVPEGISEEFAEGFLDGAISLIRLLADLKLLKNS